MGYFFGLSISFILNKWKEDEGMCLFSKMFCLWVNHNDDIHFKRTDVLSHANAHRCSWQLSTIAFRVRITRTDWVSECCWFWKCYALKLCLMKINENSGKWETICRTTHFCSRRNAFSWDTTSRIAHSKKLKSKAKNHW